MEIPIMNAQDLFNKYDEIINITMVNLYTLSKEKGVIVISDFDRKNRDHWYILRVALMARDAYGFPIKFRGKFWDWIMMNWHVSKIARFIPRDNNALPVVNVVKMLEFMYPPIREYMGENFKFANIYSQFYKGDLV